MRLLSSSPFVFHVRLEGVAWYLHICTRLIVFLSAVATQIFPIISFALETSWKYHIKVQTEHTQTHPTNIYKQLGSKTFKCNYSCCVSSHSENDSSKDFMGSGEEEPFYTSDMASYLPLLGRSQIAYISDTYCCLRHCFVRSVTFAVN